MEKSVVTGILVKNADGALLLVKKPDGVGPYAGMYLTPGGGVHTGEPIDEAVQRELYEETGVKIRNLQRVFFDDSVTENWEGVKKHFIMLAIIRWFSPEELSGINLSPPLKKLLQRLGYV
jgi:8-oxo-dGTP diphosphatase